MTFRYLWKQIIIFFQIGSETTRVVTATVAAFDVPPQGLSRNIKYGSSFSDGKSRGATGGLNSSEVWFIYLVCARNLALIGPSMVRALGPYWLPNESKSSATSQCAFEFLVANIT